MITTTSKSKPTVKDAELAVLRARGSVLQLEAWQAEALPEAILCAMAREVTFAAFERRPRWANISAATADVCIVHATTCLANSDPTIAFKTVPLDPMRSAMSADMRATPVPMAWSLSNSQRIELRSMLALVAAIPGSSAAVRSHMAACTRCGGVMSSPTVLITIEWAGRSLSREYAL